MLHWYSDFPPPMAICQKPSVRRIGTGRGVGKLMGPPNQCGTKQTCACVAIVLTLLANALHHKKMVVA